MHRITAGLLRNFVTSYELNEMSEAEQFERLVNHCVITPEVVEGYDLSDVTTGPSDDGIDGCCVLVDQEVVVSREDCEALLADGRRHHSVKLVLTQSKTSDRIDLGDVLKFHAAIERFCHDFLDKPQDAVEENAKDVYSAAIDKAGSIRDGKVELILRFAYTGKYLDPAEIEKAKTELVSSILEQGFFLPSTTKCLTAKGLDGHSAKQPPR